MNMHERSGSTLKVFGAPEKRDRITAVWKSGVADERRSQLAEIRPIRLSVEQRRQADQVEAATREYLLGKMRRLGLAEDSLLALPKVHYERRKKGKKGEGGTFSPSTNIAIAFRHNDFFDTLKVVPHELSHASVSSEVHFYFPEEEPQELTIVRASGMEFIENRRRQGVGIEEGMTLLDEVDFYTTYMPDNFPTQYQRRREFAASDAIKKQYEQIDQSLYGPLDPEIVAPVISLYRPLPRLLKRFDVPQSATIATVTMLKEYLFIRKLCEIVGRNVSEGKDFPTVDAEEAIRIGRDILDRDRYKRTGSARKDIVVALGEENAKKIFQLRDHDEDGIDDAMRVLIQVQNKN